MAQAGSLRARLLGLLLGATGAVWLATAVVTWRDAHHQIDRLLDAHLAQSARLLLVQSGHEIRELGEDEPIGLGGYGQTVVVQAWERGERLVLHSEGAPSTRLSPADTGFSDVLVEGRRWRVYSGWDREREVLVQVGEDHAARDALTRRIALNSLLPMLFALPLLGLLVWFAVSRALRPLARLGEAVERRGAGDLAPITAPGVPREAQPLVERLNGLLGRMAASLESERRFTAHAAHELRTPLAATRAQAEVARASAVDAERRAALDRVIEGCDRMTRLVAQMLLLARIEEGEGAGDAADCRLDVLARSVVAELAPGALARGVAIELDAPEPVMMRGRPDLLAVLLRNLVDNAARHGRHAVAVRCLARAGAAQLQVRDDGPGVGDDELVQLGDRFFRGAAAQPGGSGIGLTIVRRIAELHGGTVTFARAAAPQTGLHVDVTLPTCGRADAPARA